jgi:hypothetical protein
MTTKPIPCRWLDCPKEAHPDRYLCAEHLAVVYAAGVDGPTRVRDLIIGLGVGIMGNALYAGIVAATAAAAGNSGFGGGFFQKGRRDRPAPEAPTPEQRVTQKVQAGDLDAGVDWLERAPPGQQTKMLKTMKAKIAVLRERVDRA